MPNIEIEPTGSAGNYFDQFDAAPKLANPHADAIAGIESGGNYRVVGPVTRTGDRAFGKYQVMGSNIGPWSEEVLGRRVSPREFLMNPEIQDAVFSAKFGSYAEKHGPEGAAKAWFAGERGMNNPNARDQLGTSVTAYADKFNRALGPQQAQAAPQMQPQAPQPQSANFFDQFDGPQQQAPVADRFAEPPPPQNASALEAGLRQRGREITTGPAATPAQRMAIDHGNLLSGASQGTTPNIDALSKNLISTQVFQGDDGSVLFRDPQTGQVVQTDNSKHVVMRDPADNTPKVYARSAATDESAAVGVARTLAPGLMVGAPTARAAIPAAGNIQPKASDIMATAKPSYRAFEKQARATQVPAGISERIRGALDDVGLSEEMAGAPIRAALTYLDSGKMTSLNDMQKVKRIIGHGFNNSEKSVRDAAGVASRELIAAITDVAPTAAQNLKKGDAIHSTALAVQDLQRKSNISEMRAGRHRSSAVDRMTTQLRQIAEKAEKGQTTGLKPDELAAIREIIAPGFLGATIEQAAQLAPSRGFFPKVMAVGAIGGASATGGASLALPAVGSLANRLNTVLKGNQIERLKELVAKRSPEYAKAVERAVERYERAQIELINNPSPNKLAGYISASRALSSGLSRDGISISSGDFLRLLQAPVKSAAEDVEPSVPGIPSQ